MIQFKKLKWFPLLLTIMIIGFYCKKSSDNNNSGELQIVKNSSFANQQNSLQAIFTSKDNSMKGYYYGKFNSAGEPDTVTQIILNKTNGDTSLNIFLDNQQRVKSMFATYSGIKANTLFTFDYSVLGKTIVSLYEYKFNNDSSKLMYRYTVDNSSKAISERTTYASIGGSLMQILLQINTGGSSVVPDKYGSQLITAQGSVLGAGIALSVAGGYAGWGIAVGLGLSNPIGWGVVAGTIIAGYIFSPSTANASEITSIPANTPQSPYSQSQNTQLQTKSYYVGTKNSSGVVSFGGGYYTVEYTNISFELKINKQTNSITTSNFYATMNEIKQANTSPIPGYPTNRQTYTLSTFSLSGPTLTINFTQDPNSFPQNNAVFVGGLNGNSVTGTLTLNRTSNGLSCVTNIPINAVLVN